MQRKLNQIYSASNFFYYSMMASMFAFVSVFLLDKGFNNSTIGIVLALTSFFTIAFQTMFADYLDKNKEAKVQNLSSIVILIIAVSSIILYYVSVPLLILAIVVFSFSIAKAVTPLLNSMAFLYNDHGLYINYGIGRGVGSVAYASMTMVLGYVVKITTPEILPLFYSGFALFFLLFIRKYDLTEKDQRLLRAENKHIVTKANLGSASSDRTLLEFAKKYNKLILLMLGVVFLFFGHVIANNFLIQIVTPLGGDSSVMGIAIFIAAGMEFPVIMGFDKLSRRIPVHRLLKISAVFFLAKHLLTFLAPNVFVIYLAQALQVGAFGIAYPAFVQYTKDKVAITDLVKGQSLFANAMALSNVLASFTGGILLDSLGVSNTLFIAVITTVIGLVIVFLTVEDHMDEIV